MSNAKDLLHLRELHQSGLLSSEEYVAALRKLTGQRPTRRTAPRPAQKRQSTQKRQPAESPEQPGSTAAHRRLRASQDSDLPLLFALAALAVVAAAVAIYFLVAA